MGHKKHYLKFSLIVGLVGLISMGMLRPFGLAYNDHDWPEFGFNERNTRVIDTLPAVNNTLEWRFMTGDMLYSSPAVVDGLVYIGSWDNQTYCLNASTGAKVWNYTTDGPIISSPTVHNGRVYVASVDNNTYCLNATDGTKIWNYDIGINQGTATIADDYLYIGSMDNRLYCLDATDGAYKWNYTTGDWIVGHPAVVNGYVYFGSFDNNMYCLNATDGTYEWAFPAGAEVASSPAWVDGLIYFGSWDFQVYCVNATTGTKVWNYTTGDAITSSPAVWEGYVYIGSIDGQVYCFDATSGTKLWSSITGPIQSSPAVASGYLYIGSEDDNMYCLDITNGAKVWNYTTGDGIVSSPAVVDGFVYFGSKDDYVYCVGGYPLSWGLPGYQTIGLGMELNFTLSVLSSYSIDLWWINDTSRFQVSQIGTIRNATFLAAGIYHVQINVNDSTGSMLTGVITVIVEDTTPPRWIQPPQNQEIEQGTNLRYDLNATDLSGLDTWWITNTDYFNISQTGVLMNILSLDVGDYNTYINVNDTQGNIQTASITITVYESGFPPIDPMLLLIGGGAGVIIVVVTAVYYMRRK